MPSSASAALSGRPYLTAWSSAAWRVAVAWSSSLLREQCRSEQQPRLDALPAESAAVGEDDDVGGQTGGPLGRAGEQERAGVLAEHRQPHRPGQRLPVHRRGRLARVGLAGEVLGEEGDAVLARVVRLRVCRVRGGERLEGATLLEGDPAEQDPGRQRDPPLLRRRAGEDELGDRLGLTELTARRVDVDEGSARLAQNVAVVRAEFDGAAGVGLGPLEIGGVEVHLGADREVAGRLEGRVRSGCGVLLGAVEEGQALVGAPGLGHADPGASGHLGPDVGRAVAAGEDPLEDLARLTVPHRGVQRGEDPVGERVATSARRRRRTGRLDRDAHDGEVGPARPHRRCRRAGPPG